MQVKLYKKNGEYTTKDGEVKKVTNYFVECGDVLVPVEVKFFEDKKTGEDKNYRTRRTLMSAFAEELPEREKPQKPQAERAETDPTA
jgi:hypothetical protein